MSTKKKDVRPAPPQEARIRGGRLTPFTRRLGPGAIGGLLLFGGMIPIQVLGAVKLDNAGIAIVVALFVVCMGVHEAAHAWVANRCGDPTAKNLGRITLNPIVHIDLVMTIILPLCLLMSGTGFLFGGAKPVPVAYHQLRNPLRDMMLVALAGPVSNFLLAILFEFALGIVLTFEIYGLDQMMIPILMYAVHFNLLLAAFNMLPIPPLDGSRVMAWLLPPSLRSGYVALERFGMLIIIGVLIMPGLGNEVRAVVWDFMMTMRSVVNWLVDPVVELLGSFR